MTTMIAAAAMGLLWLLLIAYALIGALCTFIVWFVLRDVLKTIRIKKERRELH